MREQGRAEGRAKGEAKELQRVILALVQRHFPVLSEQAQQKVKHVKSVDELSELCLKLLNVTDEQAARQLLNS